jgi:hypothetical protein
MTRRLPLGVILMLLVASIAEARQPTTPQLTKPQRETLRAIVAAVDQAAPSPETPGVAWPIHIMRASDGSHYVAFSVTQESAPLPAGPVVLYVRLATTPLSSVQTISERSAVGEWLAGQRVDPRLKPKTGFAPGEMPNFGAGAIAARGSTASTGSTDLKLMDMERERARQEKEDRDRQRRRELDGRERASIDLLPFEDFDVNALTGSGAIQRALTAGPGDYTLYVGWADPGAKPATAVHVAKRSLHLPPATTTELLVSSVIVADSVSVRSRLYSAEEQRAHPYTMGLTDIIPAHDTTFTREERIAVAFQVINARPSETGKPDIVINFRLVRGTPDRELQVASLTPQRYDEATLPGDFDLRLGHPIFAAMAAPLATLGRGDYRLKILVSDRISGTSTTAETGFTVVGSPASLLAEAPSVGQAFRREAVLTSDMLASVVERLRPASPSPALARALDVAQKGQFVELLREEPVDAAEQGIRTTLTAMALYAVGDASSSAVQLQRALQLNAPPGPVQLFLGSARAAQGRDVDAIAAWQAGVDAGMPASSIAPFLIDAYLRRGDTAKAAALLTGAAKDANDGAATRGRAAVLIASGRELEAIPLLQTRLANQSDDMDAEWLLLHALFASVVRVPAGTASPNVEPFTNAARAYVAKGGAHAALAAEWLKVIGK